MFHMLTCFNLKSEVTMDGFRESLAKLTTHMKGIELLQSTGPIHDHGHRQRTRPRIFLHHDIS
jgi:hypothetical protein